jgi:hypothetical protein
VIVQIEETDDDGQFLTDLIDPLSWKLASVTRDSHALTFIAMSSIHYSQISCYIIHYSIFVHRAQSIYHLILPVVRRRPKQNKETSTYSTFILHHNNHKCPSYKTSDTVFRYLEKCSDSHIDGVGFETVHSQVATSSLSWFPSNSSAGWSRIDDKMALASSHGSLVLVPIA